jgi:TonB-linked SusC/RagA family outer membrane protein
MRDFAELQFSILLIFNVLLTKSELMSKKLLLLFLGVVIASVQAMAQQVTITGKITSAEDGLPIPGATVRIKGAKLATQASVDGIYSIKAEKGQALQFAYLGMETQERAVGSATTINIVLQPSKNDLNEVVVVGYGTQKRATLTGAISTVNMKEMVEARPTTDIVRSLQGAVPGLTITSSSGALGSTPNIQLRALSGSLNGGGAQPLILMDNVEIRDLQNVNPEDIESISVLKDASAASIYGTRAAWGVILITSKSGRKNTPTRVNYSNNVAFATPTNTIELASAAEGVEMALIALRRTNPALARYGTVGMYADDISVQKMKEWKQLYGDKDLGPEMVLGRDYEIRDGFFFPYREWNAGEEYMKKWTPQQKHDISVSGGSEKTTFNLAAGLLGQTGVLKVNPDEFNRKNVTLNLNSDVNKFLTLRGRVMYSNTLTTDPFSFGGTLYDPLYYLYRWPSYYPMGTINGLPVRNAVNELEQSKMNESTNSMARISLGGTVRLTKDLSVDGDYTYSSTNFHRSEVGGSASAIDFWSTGAALTYRPYTADSYNKALYRSSWDNDNYGRVTLNYNKSVNRHNFQARFGGEAQKYEYTSQSSERRNLIDPNKGEVNLATGDQFASSSRSHWTTVGVFGRLNYNFANKYIAEFTGRYDGSSRFPSGERMAFFPAVSAGWVATEEDFMSFIKPVVNTLKLKASWGQVGHQNVGNAFLSLMSSTNSNWILGANNQLTVTNPTVVSPSLTWETVTDMNVGIEARLFQNKLGVNFDVFQRTTSDMITAGVALPGSFGASAPNRNFGELRSRGWDLALDFSHTFENSFKLNLNASLSDFTEKITKFGANNRAITGNYEGKTMGEIWGYETDRFFGANDFQQNPDGSLVQVAGKYVLLPGVPSQELFQTGNFFYGPGDVKYKDINGDGVIDHGTNTVGDAGDQKVIGNTTPRYQYSFRIGGEYKGFDFGVFFQGVGSRQMWVHSPTTIPGITPGEGWTASQLDYWTESNPNAFYPRPSNVGQTANVTNFKIQTKYLLNLAYLRAKNISVGYALPKATVERLKLNKLRVYLSGENLFEFDHLNGLSIDPEVNYTSTGAGDPRSFGRVYPFRRTVSFGLQATF